MDPNNYTIKEFITHAMEDFNEKIDDIHADVKEIKIQTLKTNGRVSKLEWWRMAVLWALGALWTVLLLLGPWLIRKLVEDQVKESFNTYENTN